MHLRDERPLVFSCRSYAYLKEKLCREAFFEAGEIETKLFPDGERYCRILSEVQGREAVLIGGTISESDTTELYDLAGGLVAWGAERLHIVIPYYGYSTMERAVKTGEIVTAKSRARLLSAIPPAPQGNRLICIDLHSTGLPQYFENGLQATHIYAKSLITRAARNFGGENFVLASTDAGRAKWVESLAYDMRIEAAFVYKRRLSGSETKLTGVNADVSGKTVVIYDDMIRTGGSLIAAAKAYKEAGADEIFATATHGVLPAGSFERIKNSGMIDGLALTDTHPRVLGIAEDSFVRIYSVERLIAEAIKNSHGFSDLID